MYIFIYPSIYYLSIYIYIHISDMCLMMLSVWCRGPQVLFANVVSIAWNMYMSQSANA